MAKKYTVKNVSATDVIKPQPPLKDSTGDVWLEVIKDMQERREFGIKKYGKPVQPFNGRKPLMNAYQEILDLIVYFKQELMERDTKGG
jgi:hypothetical protein